MTKRYLFVIFCILTSFTATFAQQNDLLKNDLGKSFKSSNVVRINKVDAESRAKSNRNISISTTDKTYELTVEPRDLRSSSYYAEDRTANGARRLEKTPVTTYKGKIAGDANSEVRLTIDETGISGFFGSKNETLYIEPASKYSKNAASNEFVVYKAEDVLLNKSFDCPEDLTKEIADGQRFVSENSAATVSAMKVIEIATEADYEYVQSTGGAVGANTKILNTLNLVEGYYSRELNLTLSVVYQHTWSTQDAFETTTPRVDPNCSSTIGKILCNFQDYWNANLPSSQIRRDTAHLFSNKASVIGQGFAFLNVMCNNPNFAYGVSVRVDQTWNWEVGNSLVTAHELGHNLSATHTEIMSPQPADCYDTLMNTVISSYIQPVFCTASETQIASHVSGSGGCLTPRVTNWMDFDGDGKTDLAIYRPTLGEWWINRSSTAQTTAAQFGTATDKIASGDFTGDGKADVAIFRPSNGTWYILRSEDGNYFTIPFGTNGDVPVTGDYDGDGKADAAVFRPSNSTWYINQSSGAGAAIVQFGLAGDVPVTADYDGDGKSDIAIYRPSAGEWWIFRSTGSVVAFQFGNSADKPVQGDYTGDGKADVAIFRPSNGNWYFLRSEDGSYYSFPFGSTGDVPAPGDYDGDGKFDAAVFRPSTATWYANRTSSSTLIQTFGVSSDLPVPGAFVR